LIVDTDVIIWHMRGDEKARDLIYKSIPFDISVITYIELIQGMRDKKEMNGLIKQLSKWNIDIVQINRDISTRAMIYIEQYRHSNGMDLADALIAATCIHNSEVLITANEKHYKHIPNIQIKKFVM
jgi:predicted nucleic acid-binding protein